ncbi:MAG: SDR family NAD(P)-dependent oxidoreductase [Labilithrix sp.]
MDLGRTKKVAIITGGSDGIGRAMAERVVAEGARVVICARRAASLETITPSNRPGDPSPGRAARSCSC